MQLHILNEIPDELLTVSAKDLHKVIPGSGIIKIQGKKEPALFLSCLIHGNEITGLLVFQELLKKYGKTNWPRTTYLFFGNVWAAKEGLRQLPDRVDFNRIWTTSTEPEAQIAKQVFDFVDTNNLFASIDIHNNTGRNPHYSIVMRRDPAFFGMAAAFSQLSMFFEQELGTCTEAFTQFCPAVTLEAGLPGVADGTSHVMEFVETVMNWDERPNTSVEKLDLKLLEAWGIIKVPTDASVSVGDQSGDVQFSPDLDLINFTDVKPGTVWGTSSKNQNLVLRDLDKNDVTSDYFEVKDGAVISKKVLIPAMITPIASIIKSDCLCYVLREIEK